ncbi:DUF5979 domain-containing protein [Streptococcus sp. zg-JUN1979]|uniref:vWA domain-containing protein n=1 Tax=Streptococcus sp. zg-JUN1979 TaxID=3391450 RepID=UPI0039A432DA
MFSTQKVKRMLYVCAMTMLFLAGALGMFSVSARADNSNAAPTIKKTIHKLEGDDDYQLRLSLIPSSTTITTSHPLDVIFIADTSGSMRNALLGTKLSRLDVLKETLQTEDGLIDSLLGNGDNRFSLVSFAGQKNDTAYSSASVVTDWTSDVTQAKSGVNTLQTWSGRQTNLQAGLYRANQLAAKKREDAKLVVILLTDGAANMYCDDQGNAHYDDDDKANIQAGIKQEINHLSSSLNGFYSINFSNGSSNLETIHSYLSNLEAQAIYRPINQAQLLEALGSITNNILELNYKDVTITDVLSDYVMLMPDGAENSHVVRIKDGVETVLDSSQVSISTQSNSQGKVEVHATFADNYQMDSQSMYELRFNVTISQYGQDYFADHPELTNLPSNDSAKVTYTYDNTSYEQTYPDEPVVEPTRLSAPIEIIWETYDESQIPDSVDAALTKDGTEAIYRDVSVTKENWQSSFNHLAKGHEYELVISDIEGFTKTVENLGSSAQPSYRVTYRQLPSLLITKHLEGESSDKAFTILIEASHQGQGLNGEYGGISFVDGKASLSLKAGETQKIEHLPLETSYHVKEADESAAGYEVSYDQADGVLVSQQKTVTITNRLLPQLSLTKTVVGENGDKSKPFTMTLSLKDKDGQALTGDIELFRDDKCEKVSLKDGSAQISLKHNETVTIKHLAFGTQYAVVEDSESSYGYQVSYDNATGTLDSNQAVQITNTMPDIVSTGTKHHSKSSGLLIAVSSVVGLLVLVCIIIRKIGMRR